MDRSFGVIVSRGRASMGNSRPGSIVEVELMDRTVGHHEELVVAYGRAHRQHAGWRSDLRAQDAPYSLLNVKLMKIAIVLLREEIARARSCVGRIA
eukprot:3747321-Rhodomonas_salina.3